MLKDYSNLKTYKLTVSYQEERGVWHDYGTYTVYAESAKDASEQITQTLKRTCAWPTRIDIVSRVSSKVKGR